MSTVALEIRNRKWPYQRKLKNQSDQSNSNKKSKQSKQAKSEAEGVESSMYLPVPVKKRLSSVRKTD